VQGPVTYSIVLSRLSICFVTSGGEDRNMLTLLERVEVPVYLGCDWQNVALHLAHTFTAIACNIPRVRNGGVSAQLFDFGGTA
jgi:hypothetical protein